jgi:methionyl-tRNA formyltransferase
VEVVEEQSGAAPGIIADISSTGILVNTKTNLILIKKLQFSGKKPVNVANLINGKHIFKVGESFTS